MCMHFSSKSFGDIMFYFTFRAFSLMNSSENPSANLLGEATVNGTEDNDFGMAEKKRYRNDRQRRSVTARKLR